MKSQPSNPHNQRVQVAQAIRNVIDPELFVSIVDLGLIYGIEIRGSEAHIIMTLTTIGCPLFSILEEDIKKHALGVSGIQSVTLELVFDPPWTMEMIAPEARAELGLD